MKSLQGYGQKSPMVVPCSGMAAAPHPFVRFSLFRAHDKDLVKVVPEVASVATALVLVQCVHLAGALALTRGRDVHAHCLQAAHALPQIHDRDPARAALAWTILAPASGRRILPDADPGGATTTGPDATPPPPPLSVKTCGGGGGQLGGVQPGVRGGGGRQTGGRGGSTRGSGGVQPGVRGGGGLAGGEGGGGGFGLWLRSPSWWN